MHAIDKERVRRLMEELKNSLDTAVQTVGLSEDDFMGDVRNRYTLRLALVEVVESAVDVGLHVLREDFGVDRVEGYLEIFRKLVQHGVLSHGVGVGMERLTRLRNLIIHRYWEVDDERMYREARGSGLELINRFARELLAYVSGT